MNALLTSGRVIEAQGGNASSEPVGELLAAWPVAPGAILVLGWQKGRLHGEGVVQIDRDSSRRGPYRAVSWEAEGAVAGLPLGCTWLFIAALRLPPSSAVAPGQTLLLLPAGTREAMIAQLPERFADGADFADTIARLAGGHALPCLRFLLETIAPSAMRRVPQTRAMIERLIAGLAEPDGCIELLGPAGEGGVFLQGWAGETREPGEVILVGETIEFRASLGGRFAREDIAPPSAGLLLLVPETDPAGLAGLRQVVVADGTRLCRREVIDGRIVLPEAECAPHLAAMLPRIQGEPELIARLREATRARFDGRDTVNVPGAPVRAAVDVAVSVPGGIYLHGWVYDPASRVAEWRVGGAGAAARLDTRWTRIPRIDVAQAFAGDASLPTADPARDRHGFAAFVPLAAPPSHALHLECRTLEGGMLFLPLAAGEATARDGVARMLASADLYKPSGLAVVERQLAPAFAQLANAIQAAAARVVTPIPEAGSMRLAIVVPLGDDVKLPASFLSQFMLDPLDADERLVFVCGEAWEDAAVARLRQALSLRGLAGGIIVADRPMRAPLALDLAASCIPGEAPLLLADAGLHGVSPGWRAALRHAAIGLDCVSPTLLYEDGSIRFAGIDAVEGLQSAPYARIRRPLAGMQAALAPAGGTAVPVLAGSLACCLITRAALRRAGGAARIWPGLPGEEIDWFLRLSRAGIEPHWFPGARLYATEAASQATGEVARLADGLCLRALWCGPDRTAKQEEAA